ncbi:MAG: metallopeptidase TldD-related protein [Burkholderiales bacterium]|nr:metallopeptidase TldD-related protein [Burkholderiales bacterium]
MSSSNFLYSQQNLQEKADLIINEAIKMGASSAQVELSESISTDVEILNQQIDNFETSHENQLLITVFKGHKKGNIGISSIEPKNLPYIIQQALDIATFTEEDSCNGILGTEFLAKKPEKNLNLYNPYSISNQELISEAKELESIASDNLKIKSSDGSSVSMTHYNFVTANSNGFNDGYQTSRYSKYVSLIGETKEGMQTDYWYASSRNFNKLDSNASIAQKAQERITRRLNTSSLKDATPTVVFETQIAKSIIGSLMGAISGSSLYRKLSFLNDSLGKLVLPEWININENPFIDEGLSSCYFDNEGGQVTNRNIIENGQINGYLLSGYSARKLNMKPTGNSGGNHNLEISNNFNGGISEIAKEIGNGIVIIETIGHGLNMVTGDYSVGASGLVIENGIITGFADNLTIAGNMIDIFKNISLIANDYTGGSILCGSMVINKGVISVSGK